MLLVARPFNRQAFHVGLNLKPFYFQPQVERCYMTLSRRSAARPSRILRVSAAGGGALTATLMLCWGYSLYPDVPDVPSPPSLKEPTPLSKLLASYVVYSACSMPGLVEASPNLLALCTSIPGLRQLTEIFVRVTFFKQFVGGDTAHGCLPVIRKLRAENKGALLAYSVEADGAAHPTPDEPHQPIEQMIHAVEVAASFEDSLARESSSSGRRTWVAIKLSALSPNPAALIHLSAYLSSLHARDPTLFPGCPRIDDLSLLNSNDPPPDSPLSAQDLSDLRDLHEGLHRICIRARERDVRLIIDAESSWYQPAIDSISLALMGEFNKERSPPMRWLSQLLPRAVQHDPPPLIYVTCQAYLRRTPEYLAQSLRDAASNRYTLGIKLVRGAYHEQEVMPSSPSLPLTTNASWPPVFTSKVETDRCYDAAIEELVRAVANSDGCGSRVGVLFASHNPESCARVLDALVNVGLATHEEDGMVKLDDSAAERVSLAQLYGMSDTLTDRIAASVKTSAPFVIKYIPYGALSEVMPYLSRRAIENKSVLGDGRAAEERKRAFDALWKRLFRSREGV